MKLIKRLGLPGPRPPRPYWQRLLIWAAILLSVYIVISAVHEAFWGGWPWDIHPVFDNLKH